MPTDPAPPELLPCPCCGAKAAYRRIEGHVVHFGVCCTRCFVAIDSAFSDRENAAAQWNRRAPHPDARRLDLIERHAGMEVLKALGQFVVRCWMPPGGNVLSLKRIAAESTVREAIDAAEKVLGDGPEKGE